MRVGIKLYRSYSIIRLFLCVSIFLVHSADPIP
uniref:Uncharacterized protein n=1 Tax=Arundo donax TaxID=35708 RepID=A0A0A9HEW2_ARUDO